MSLISRVFDYLKNPSMFPLFNFNKLENKGERIDIDMTREIEFDKLNLFQKIHYNRYLFLKNTVDVEKDNLDIACGTGYGTIIMASTSKTIEGYDIDKFVIESIKERYKNYKNVSFGVLNILDLNFSSKYDNIFSFETLEHFTEKEIYLILKKYHTSLKSNGVLYFSTPYKQNNDWRMKILGHHKTFEVDENKIQKWLGDNSFKLDFFKYQNYKTFEVSESLDNIDIIICKCTKI